MRAKILFCSIVRKCDILLQQVYMLHLIPKYVYWTAMFFKGIWDLLFASLDDIISTKRALV